MHQCIQAKELLVELISPSLVLLLLEVQSRGGNLKVGHVEGMNLVGWNSTAGSVISEITVT